MNAARSHDIPDWRTDTIYLFNLENGALLNRDYRFTKGWYKRVDKKLGPLPEGFAPWRALLMDSKKDEKIAAHFDALKMMSTPGSQLALAYLKKTKEIAQTLIDEGVAKSAEDVNAVLTNGFFWLYGPINNYT